MAGAYDVWRTCRTCLFKAEELVSLDGASDIGTSSDSEAIATKTNSDLLMELTNVQVNDNDGLPRNICNECAAALRAAFAYKQLCEQSDAKLRQIFHRHLNSARVKVERIDVSNDHETVRPFEEHLSDDKTLETFDEFSQQIASDNDDDWTMPIRSSEGSENSEDDEKMDPTFDLNAAENGTKVKRTEIKGDSSTVNSNQIIPIDLSEMVKEAKCEDGSWICRLCNKTLRNRRSWKLHIRRHSNLKKTESNAVKINRQPILRLNKENRGAGDEDEDVKLLARAQCVEGRWLCEICKKTFADRNSLKMHIRVHLGLHLKQCPMCPKSFAKTSFLDFHMKSHEMKNFRCPKCDMVFNSKEARRQHMSDAHKEEKPPRTYMCEVCSKVFNRVNTLNQHKITHTGEKKFACEICHKKLGTKASLQIHMLLHGDRAGLYRFLCPHCGKKFTTGAHMAGHIRTEHTGERPYKCETCDLAFHRYDNWAQHRLKHVERYVCTMCGKSLSSKARLDSHTRIHSGEKPYKCTVCDHAFSTWKSLKTHLHRHSGENIPNKCNVCGSVFANEKQLEKHRRQFDHQLPLAIEQTE